jgi:flagellar basal-body rod protein FlgB
MALTDIPILSMLRTRMEWHQARQQVLAENVANADTAGYRARDLSQLKFEDTMAPPVGTVALAQTEKGHIAGGLSSSSSPFRSQKASGYEVRPTGNAVSLEDEMIKVAANQLDFQAATTLYSKSLKLIKTALGKV